MRSRSPDNWPYSAHDAWLQTTALWWALWCLLVFVVAACLLRLGQVVLLILGFAGPAELLSSVCSAYALLLPAGAAAYALGHTWRMQLFKRHWRGDAIAPRGYARGHCAML